jgi:hypothetical protein
MLSVLDLECTLFVATRQKSSRRSHSVIFLKERSPNLMPESGFHFLLETLRVHSLVRLCMRKNDGEFINDVTQCSANTNFSHQLLL